MPRRDAESVDMTARSVSLSEPMSVTDDEFANMSRFFDPEANIRPSDVYGFRMIASGDGLDAYYTRQDIDTSLKRYVDDLKRGQSVLGGHQYETFSYGQSYDAEMVDANALDPAYEGVFYPKFDQPGLRTTKWVIGKYYIARDVTLNGQPTNDLIRAMQMGATRKSSITFTIGEYICGIDGKDMLGGLQSLLDDGELDEKACKHFPGLVYNRDLCFAWMKHNSLLETSLVYKNASPSAMLVRKAEGMAARGMIPVAEVVRLEERFNQRLPRPVKRLHPGASVMGGTRVIQVNPTPAAAPASGNVTIRFEDTNTALARATRLEGGKRSHPELPDSAFAVIEKGAKKTNGKSQDNARHLPHHTESGAIDEALLNNAASRVNQIKSALGTESDGALRARGRRHLKTHGALKGESMPDLKDLEVVDETGEEDPPEPTEPTPPTEPEEPEGDQPAEGEEEATADEKVSEFVKAAEAAAYVLQHSPSEEQVKLVAEAQRGLEGHLTDAGSEESAGHLVARQYETRQQAIREALGEEPTAEKIRQLKADAELGTTLFGARVKEAVSARVRAFGDRAGAEAYEKLLMSGRDIEMVENDIALYGGIGKETFGRTRQIQPREPTETKPGGKSAPKAPADPEGNQSDDNILRRGKKE